MKLRLPLMTFVLTSLELLQPVAAGESVTKQVRAVEARIVEARIVESLRREMECNAGDGIFSCTTEVRGLQVEFSGTMVPATGSIRIRALGKNQTVSNVGRRCLLVTFTDEGTNGLAVHVILRDDAVISGMDGNEKARAACE
jgi:hypothetical protein